MWGLLYCLLGLKKSGIYFPVFRIRMLLPGPDPDKTLVKLTYKKELFTPQIRIRMKIFARIRNRIKKMQIRNTVFI